MMEERQWSRDHYILGALREEKAARESTTEEARLAHQQLAKLYRGRAAGTANENSTKGAFAF